MNVGRLFAGALVAGVICFIGDFVTHGLVLGDTWSEFMASIGKPTEGQEPAATDMLLFFVFALLKGLYAVFLYVVMRARFGAGPKTALFAGLLAWAGLVLIPHFVWMNVPVFPKVFVAQWMIFEGPALVLGTLAGGWLYKEGA